MVTRLIVIVDIAKYQGFVKCIHRDEKYGYCNSVAKYTVNGVLCCGTHVLQVIKKMLENG